MSEHIVVNDKQYLPSGELAKAFSYTIDYVSKLAREGKVDATRIGRQWFINPESLKSFVAEAEQKKIEQREQLRAARREEFQASQKELVSEKVLSANNSLVPANAGRTPVVSPYQPKVSAPKHVVSAVLGTSMVIFAGLLFAFALTPDRFVYLFEDSFVAVKDQQAGAMSSYRETPSQNPVLESQDKMPVDNGGRGVVILEPTATDAQVREVQEMFSDEVEVDFTDENTGVITPVFKEGTNESYRFIMVPVKDSS